MSTHFSLSPMASILLLALVALLVLPTTSTSRHTLDHSNPKTGFRVTLKHVDSGKNFTKHELLQRVIKRGRKRMEKLNAIVVAASNVSIEAPTHAGDGEFLMDLSIGTPPLFCSAIFDTGSDLTWTQCKPCQFCFDQPTPVFDPRSSSSYTNVTCSSKLCKELGDSTCDEDGNCEYSYAYGDSSKTKGVLATETFTFDDNVSVPKVGFGCGHDNEGDFEGSGAGIVGLGGGPLSLVSQLQEPKFSYCLTSYNDSSKTSILLVGSEASINRTLEDSKIATPLIKNPYDSTFYYLSIQGITIGETLLPIKNSTFGLRADGFGGTIIDSGTTITYLEKSAFDEIKKEFTSQIKLPRVDNLENLELCYTFPPDVESVKVPKFVFHLKGGDLDLPQENYFFIDTVSGVGCLLMGSSVYGLSIFGNVQQQNTLVLYDLVGETLSLVPTQCDQL